MVVRQVLVDDPAVHRIDHASSCSANPTPHTIPPISWFSPVLLFSSEPMSYVATTRRTFDHVRVAIHRDLREHRAPGVRRVGDLVLAGLSRALRLDRLARRSARSESAKRLALRGFALLNSLPSFEVQICMRLQPVQR